MAEAKQAFPATSNRCQQWAAFGIDS